jgi:conjugative transfer signal peptidase TraF
MRGEWTLRLARDAGRPRRVRLVLSILAASALLVVVAEAFDLRVNWTESMPRGLYQRVEPSLVRGEWVAVCLVGNAAELARDRAYVIDGACPSGLAEIVKRIAAVPGDRVALGRDGVRINSRPLAGSELQDRDSRGAPLPHAAEGELVLAEGRYFVMGAKLERSWDSRYFGPIAREQIVSGARPIWTF